MTVGVHETIHEGYVCSKCEAHRVKLWRQYNTFACYIELMCRACTEKDQNKIKRPGSDQIGRMVPAVPTDDGTFWGYTSAPLPLVEWWKALPEVQP